MYSVKSLSFPTLLSTTLTAPSLIYFNYLDSPFGPDFISSSVYYILFTMNFHPSQSVFYEIELNHKSTLKNHTT